eukprot:1157024-Pelagomonas_calceolata.AAC.3
MPSSVILVSSFQNRGTSISWRSNTVKTPGPRISWRPSSNSTATSAAISQGPQLKYPPYHSVRCGRGHLHPPHPGASYTAWSDTHTATRLALELHAHSVQYAYKLFSTRHALEKTPLNSRHQDQARATASNPPDPH